MNSNGHSRQAGHPAWVPEPADQGPYERRRAEEYAEAMSETDDEDEVDDHETTREAVPKERPLSNRHRRDHDT